MIIRKMIEYAYVTLVTYTFSYADGCFPAECKRCTYLGVKDYFWDLDCVHGDGPMNTSEFIIRPLSPNGSPLDLDEQNALVEWLYL